jgi:hypothetical protein
MQNDNYSNIDKSSSEYREKSKTGMFLYPIIVILAVTIIVLFYLLNVESHYEKGNAFLKEKNIQKLFRNIKKLSRAIRISTMLNPKLIT